jgi:hypothetical protein
MKISTQKTKIMAFVGIEPIRNKRKKIDIAVLEQVNILRTRVLTFNMKESFQNHTLEGGQILRLSDNTLTPNLV